MMHMDKQSAKEMVEAVLWWENRFKCLWDKLFGPKTPKAVMTEDPQNPDNVIDLTTPRE